MKKNKGFTLIELLVVIAIIGILASVVLAALSSARTKGVDAKVKSTFGSLHTQAELYYSDNNESYSGICTEGGATSTGVTSIYNILLSVAKDFGLDKIGNSDGGLDRATCNEDGNAWAAEMPLKNTNGGTTNMFCADSTGFAGAVAGTIEKGVVCNSSVINNPDTRMCPPGQILEKPEDPKNTNCIPDPNGIVTPVL